MTCELELTPEIALEISSAVWAGSVQCIWKLHKDLWQKRGAFSYGEKPVRKHVVPLA